MNEPSDERGQVERLLRRHAPAATKGTPLAFDLSLAEDGLGFDSVGLVELLLAGEDLFGAGFAANVLADPPLTVGKLMAHAGRSRDEASVPGTS